MSAVIPKSLGSPTSEEIKTVWLSTPNPSQRGVEKIMRSAGWDVSASTIIRVVNSGFAPRTGPHAGKSNAARAVRTSPGLEAVRQVQSMAPDDAPPSVVAEAMVEAIRNLPDGQRDRVKDLLAMDDAELIMRSQKLYRVAGVLLAEDLATHTKLMMLAPEKAAKLWQALGSSLGPTIAPPQPGAGNDARVIDHNPNEPQNLSPSAQAIRAFKAKRGSAAA